MYNNILLIKVIIMIKYSKKSEFEIELLQEATLNHPHHFIRRKALSQLLHQYEVHPRVIEQVLGVCENTLRSYCKGYEGGGIDFITAINFRKPESELTPFKDVVLQYLDENPPGSIKQACAEIGELTGVHRQESQMRNYLKKNGARCRQVCGIPAKADIAKQNEFKENKLEPLLKEAEEGLREVYFVDAAHFVLQAFLGKIWSISRVFIRTPSGRQRWNVLGAINAITKEVTTVSNNTYITAVEVCLLLKKIALKNIESNAKISEDTETLSETLKKESTSEEVSVKVEIADVDGSKDPSLTQKISFSTTEVESSVLAAALSGSSSDNLDSPSEIVLAEETKEIQKIVEPAPIKKPKKDKEAIKKERELAAKAQARIEANGLRVVTPVSIFLDNARYQRCLAVTSLAEALGIKLEFLPSYSPNLNLIERLWKLTKKECLNCKYYKSFDPFCSAIMNFLNNMTSTHSKELKSLLTLKFQTFTEEQIKKAL